MRVTLQLIWRRGGLSEALNATRWRRCGGDEGLGGQHSRRSVQILEEEGGGGGGYDKWCK